MFWMIRGLIIWACYGITFDIALVGVAVFIFRWITQPLTRDDPDSLKSNALQSQHEAERDQQTEKEKNAEGAGDEIGRDAALAATSTQPTIEGPLTIRQQFEPSKESNSFMTGRREGPPRELFDCSLKGSVLFLYEDKAEGIVNVGIDLANYVVGIENAEGGKWRGKDGEMYSKRNAIVLRRVSFDGESNKGLAVIAKGMSVVKDGKAVEDEYKPYFIFCRPNSKMEDWHLALLKVSAEAPKFDKVWHPSDMEALVERINSEPDPFQLRGPNALFGRIWLGVYYTAAVPQFIINKLHKQLSKLQRPSFLSPIVVREVNIGRDPPYLSKVMLKETEPDGRISLAAHLSYRYRPNVADSAVRITVATAITISTGIFKDIKLDVILAVELKSLEGDIIAYIKKPPSNRIWWSFIKEPEMDIEIKPVVADRKFNISYALEAMEKQLKKAISESIVAPNGDDIAFFDTSALDIRGGIFNEAGRDNVEKYKNPATISGDGIGPLQPGLDIGTSNEAPSVSTVEAAANRKRHPNKPNTVDSNGSVPPEGKQVSSSIRTSPERPRSNSLPRTETSPAELVSTSPKKTAKRWFMGTKGSADSLSGSLGGQRRASKGDELERLHKPHHRASLDEMNDFSAQAGSDGISVDTISINDDKSDRLSAPTELQKRSRSADAMTETSLDLTQVEDFSTSTLNITNNDNDNDVEDVSLPGRSSSSLLAAVRTRDKKALASQVNVAREGLKKWGANWAAKRRVAAANKFGDGFDEVDEDRPAAYYGPGDEMGHAAAISTRLPGEGGRENGGKSLQERLNAAAQVGSSVIGHVELDRQRSASSIGPHTHSSPGSIRPSIFTSPSKSSNNSTSSSSAGISSSSNPPQFNLAAPRAITEVAKDDIAASSLSTMSSSAPTVQSQPAGARSMVVPRVPKRPGAVTGIGSIPSELMRRRTSDDGQSQATVLASSPAEGGLKHGNKERQHKDDNVQLHEVGSAPAARALSPPTKSAPPSLPPRPATAKNVSSPSPAKNIQTQPDTLMSHPLENSAESKSCSTSNATVPAPSAPTSNKTLVFPKSQPLPSSKLGMESTSSAQVRLEPVEQVVAGGTEGEDESNEGALPDIEKSKPTSSLSLSLLTPLSPTSSSAQDIPEPKEENADLPAVQASVAEDRLRMVAERNEAKLKAAATKDGASEEI